MSRRQSYLDTLNAGRQRRPRASVDELSRTLENLEARFRSISADQSRPQHDSRTDDIAARMERLSSEAAYPGDSWGGRGGLSGRSRRPAESTHSATPFQTLARDFERAREQDEGVAAVSRIATELRDLREEMRNEMSAGLHREFEALRNDIERAYASASNGSNGSELRRELDRISRAVQGLADKNDDRGINLLRHELEEVKQAIGSLAREDTLRSVDNHWNEFGRRWDAFEERVANQPAQPVNDPALGALYERLEEISEAVQELPESLSLRSLDDKVRTIATALDRFSEDQNRASPEAFGVIEARLDEISRAIIASSVANQPSGTVDHAILERIETGMSSLAEQLEVLDSDRPAIFESLTQLSQRIEDISRRADQPNEVIEHLANQIDVISRRVEQAGDGIDSDAVLRTLENRLQDLSEKIDRQQGDANTRNEVLLRDLETQLSQMSQRLDARESEPANLETSLMEAIDARFAAFSSRLDEGRGPADPQAMQKLENRLDSISSQLDSSTQQLAGVDPALIRSLEEQVSGLSSHLSHPSGSIPEFEDIQPRLISIEQSIAGSREDIMDAARRAAEEAVKNVSFEAGDSAAVSGLAGDLKSLEELARKSDERNTRTFEAIHDTLLKIVDRLGSLENGQPQPEPAPVQEKMAVEATPSVDPYEEHPTQADDVAYVDEVHADSRIEGPEAQDEPENKSLFSGISRALSGRKKSDADELAGDPPADEAPAMPKADFDPHFEDDMANRPLEPGSGAPDLQEIMKRVRKERSQPAKPDDSNASQSDFIAAARRAAQAAAAEAEVLKKKSENSGESGRFQASEFLKLKRKPILMAAAAIMIALAGLQLGKAFISDQDQVASIDSDPVPVVSEQMELPADPVEMVMDETPVAGPDVVAEDPVRMVETDADAMDAAPTQFISTGDNAPATQASADNAMSAPAMARDTAKPAAAAPATAAQTYAVPPIDAGPVTLREAAAEGNPRAMFAIGARYAKGQGVKADMAEAAKWYERAADLGFAPAQYRIGNFSEKGIGVTRDLKKAKTWYQLAAAQGNASAMHNLAVLHAMGTEGSVDNDSAARWFIEAAELGVRDSQFNLGILAAKGVGMKQDLGESYKWFALAAKSGDKDAATKRDEVANAMQPEQLTRARAAAELWKPKSLNQEANSVDIPDEWTESQGQTASIDMKKAVTNIQLILNKNGYDAGPPDGLMGARTKSAIKAFQKANGMKATGDVNEELVRVLLNKK